MKLSYVIVYVPDVPAAVAFYERAFGVSRRFVHESGQFAEMDTGATALSFTAHALAADAVPATYRALSPDEEAPGFELTLVDDDVPAAFRRAVEAGAAAVAEPHDTPWGQTVAYVRDHVGTLVGLATPMAPA